MSRRLLSVAGVMAAALAIAVTPASAAQSVVVAFVGAPTTLTADPQLTAVGLLDPSQISYNQQQALLDLSQGAWIPPGDYAAKMPPLVLLPSGRFAGWPAAVARAAGAHSSLLPGLLAQSVPGGGAFVSVNGAPATDAIAVANRAGAVALRILSPPAQLAQAVEHFAQLNRLVIADLPGEEQLSALLALRPADQVVFAVQELPPTAPTASQGALLLAIGAAGPGIGSGLLRSQSTRLNGLVTMPDLSISVLKALGLPIPDQFIGQPITVSGTRDSTAPAHFYARLRVIESRRMPTIQAFLLIWLALVLAAGALLDRRGVRAMMRVGGLAVLWAPCTTMLAGALRPGRGIEGAVIIGGGLALGWLSDRVLPWPRAPILPAAGMLLLYTVDLARGSPLIAQSLFGPDPLLGARFYGIGNELEAALPIVLFAGVAAALPKRTSRGRDALLFGLAGLYLTAIVAWGRMGADVGALFTIGGGTAAGVVLLAPGGATRRNVAIAVAIPFIGLVALAVLDLVTGAGGHYTDTVLHAHSISARLDVLRRKAQGAWHELRSGLMPFTTAASLAAGAYAIRFRERLLEPVEGSRAWLACLGGGFTGSIVGSLANDSGPQLLLIGTFALACVVAYLRGRPPTAS